MGRRRFGARANGLPEELLRLLLRDGPLRLGGCCWEATVSLCVAVDNEGNILSSTNPTGAGSAWSFVNVISPYGSADGSGNAMNGISCPTEGLCVAAAGGFTRCPSVPPAGVLRTA